MEKKINVAIVGVGARGTGLFNEVLKFREDCEYVAICDVYMDRCENIAKQAEENGRKRPALYTDYKKCLDEIKPDAVIVATSWEMHIPVSIYAMEKGIPVACEVGGAYSMQSLWDLVRCYERTKTPIMMMENCCFGQLELLALNLTRMGLLGEIVHCEGGYRHNLSEEILKGEENRHYRLQQYIHRNTENYPTHEIGPIAKILNINTGNRFVSLFAMGSKSVGLNNYAKKHGETKYENQKFNQSDVVTTLIKCANGETVRITLDTSLPRYYSRDFMIEGTEGLVNEQNNSVFLTKDFPGEYWTWNDQYNNVDKYYEQYGHPIWKKGVNTAAGHGGMDGLEFEAFFTALKENKPMPIDVYDYATWACISILAEESLASGQQVAFPDFTDGQWILRKNEFAK